MEDKYVMRDEYIVISLEEYKELLMTKGKYEELKHKPPILPYGISQIDPIPKEPYKITFDTTTASEKHVPRID